MKNAFAMSDMRYKMSHNDNRRILSLFDLLYLMCGAENPVWLPLDYGTHDPLKVGPDRFSVLQLRRIMAPNAFIYTM